MRDARRSIVPVARKHCPFLWWQAFAQIFYGGVFLITGSVLYSVLNKLALNMSGTNPEYIANFINLDNLKAPRWLVGLIALQARATYSDSAGLVGASMTAAVVALVCTVVPVARVRLPMALPNLLLFAVLLGTPFLLCLLAGRYGLPTRAMVALPYVVWRAPC